MKWEFIHLVKQKTIYIMLVLFACFILLGHSVIDTSSKPAYDELQGPISQQDIKDAMAYDMTTPSTYSNPYLTVLYAEQLSQMQEEKISELASLNKASEDPEIKAEIQYRENVDTMYLTNYQLPELIVLYVSNESAVFIAVLLLLGVYSIFSRDVSTGVFQYVLTSKYGRTKLVTAKIIVSLAYTLLVYLVVVVGSWTYQIYRASANLDYWKYIFDGWEAPLSFISGFALSPYALSVMEYHVVQLGFLLLGSLALTVLFLVVSAISKNSFTSFLICAGIFFVPIIVVDIVKAVPSIKWINAIYPYSPTYTMKVDSLFDTFRSMNIGSFVIIGPYIALVSTMVFIVGSLLFLKWYVRDRKLV